MRAMVLDKPGQPLQLRDVVKGVPYYNGVVFAGWKDIAGAIRNTFGETFWT